MATLSHSESRRLYSWWWDSHISPKNSKWLQENLTDMDAKVKAMIKLIEEDADSFARRAEMYYKKRPELMKLVEEFYRAYRALAERYDHATGELRQAHRTMAEAFPNQVPYVLQDDLVEGEPRTPEMPHPIRGFLDSGDLLKGGAYSEESDPGVSSRGLKQLHDMFGSAAKSGERKMKKVPKLDETTVGDAGKEAQAEVETLKRALEKIRAEKEAVFLQYQQSLEKLSSLERNLKEAGGLDERASRAEIEIKILKEALAKLESERDAGLLQHNKYLERISALENMITQLQEEAKGVNERAVKAEVEAQNLKQELSRLESEKEAGLLQYKQCIELISMLQSKISLAEDNARLLNELIEKAESEVKALKEALAKLNEEKYVAELRYEQCLERIAVMESEISRAENDVKRLNGEILMGAEKLQKAEEHCSLLERSNESLQLEAENLVHKIARKDHELSEKENELEKLQTSLQDEHSRFVQVETTLQTLQKLLSQSQDEQRALAEELQHKLQMLKDLEASNGDLQADLLQAKEENHDLNELNSTFSISVTNLTDEICNLKEMKEKLEEEVSLQVAQTNALQQEIDHLKEEIEGLNRRYQALLAQVQSVGLNPDCLSSSIKDLQEENMRLKDVCEKERDEREVLHGKLSSMNVFLEKNVALERSLLELNDKLEGSREKVKELESSCQLLQAEKSGIAAEKAIMLSQLQIMTENVQKILEKNALLETTLSSANVELEVLRTKSKGLEELCEMLKNEKHNLQNERGVLVSQLENVEQRLANLERRFTRLEEKYTDLEKEKESTNCQVKLLWDHLGVEKKERSYYVQSSLSQMAELENQVHRLQEERSLSKKEFEEELDKAVNAQVEIFILQKFIKDLEEKNLSLLYECQKHTEASKLSDKLIQDLETENLEQQVEVEFLLDEIEKLRMGIRQVFRSLQFGEHDGRMEEEQVSLMHILNDIEDLKSSLQTSEDEKEQLMVENLVLLTFFEQLGLEGGEVYSQKKVLEQEFEIIAGKHDLLQKENHELLEMSRQLMSEVSKGEQREKVLEGQLETQLEDLVRLQGSYGALQEENLKAIGESKSLSQNFSNLKEEMRILEEESSSTFEEAVALSTLSLVFENFGIERAEKLREVSENLSCLQAINEDLKKKIGLLGMKLESNDQENVVLKATIEKLQIELNEEKDLSDRLNCQLSLGQDFLRQKATELLEAKEKLEAANDLNAEYCRTIAQLKNECQESIAMREKIENQIIKLSEDSTDQKNEIESLHQANAYLEAEVDVLRIEVEERKTIEENLNLELLERTNEFELWEAEASSFYFDLQISSIREALLEDKVHELTASCDRLEEQNVTKDVEIQQMKERFSCLESEIGGLKAHLSAYVPVIACLRENIESLEQNALPRLKPLRTSSGRKGIESPIHYHGTKHQELENDEKSIVTDGISDLLRMQSKVKAIQNAVLEQRDRVAAEKDVDHNMDRNKMQDTEDQLKSPPKVAEQLELRDRSDRRDDIQMEMLVFDKEPSDKARSKKSKPEIAEVRIGSLMKDIQLDQVSDRSISRRTRSRRQSSGATDQMLELWESAEKDCIVHPVSRSPKQASPKSIYHRSKSKQKSRNSSMDLQIEKEVGIDRLEVSAPSAREPTSQGSRGRILERLASDHQNLMSLQTTVQDLKKRMQVMKKSKRANDAEFQRVKIQLEEVEEAVLQLSNTNDQLKKEIEKCPSSLDENASMGLEEAGSVRRKRVTEQARKRSEKIGRLQFEVQSIQYVLLKLEDEKKSKGKSRFSRSRTGIILTDFISSGRRIKARRKKGCFCGCARPSSPED
ncbi:hypothetical protein Tsubulata_024926 [Turnera subulata]|uniref:NAB domain-containing protein n=1 Tax=Turnera subulata TaxID=218843 RepID=A0A9Q0G5R1_9ROSI|nr:hypothetical protein Tsubulata_024926 [Turnera subulata]